MRHPRPATLLPALLLFAGLAAVAVPAFAERKVVVGAESKNFPLEGARRLKLDVAVGDVRVEAGGGDRIEAKLELRCSTTSRRCRERAAELHLTPTRSGDDLSLRLHGYDREERHGMHHPEVDLRLVVPASLALFVDMGVGELEVDGVEGDVTVDLGVGEASVRVPEGAVRSVALDVGVGEAQLSPRQDESHHSGFLFLGNEVDWRDGVGASRIVVDIGVGEAQVRLLP
ncbi:MAG TPA: hypothetical protein VFS60_05710 [Thermoanaerobaculia bacterium]|nr:hypothetical protein [Thermoanaerobaculia bacterium]